MIEIIATNKAEAIMIEKAKADRIELIADFNQGGLTPARKTIKEVLAATTIPVNIIIRPHSKSFVYTEGELNQMIDDILFVRKQGANGVVFGVLDESNNIDEIQLKQLILAAGDLDITFHRAIDDSIDIHKALKTLTNYPEITSVLTSGTRGNILNNLNTLKEMIKNKKHLNILIGGGLNFDNIKSIKEQTNNSDFHFGSCVRFNNSTEEAIDFEKLTKLINLLKK